MDNDTNTKPSEVGEASDPSAELAALQTVIATLQPFSSEARARLFEAAATFLRIHPSAQVRSSEGPWPGGTNRLTPSRPPYSDVTSMSPKEFLLEKQPRTDVERIACLAFYLTHYRDTQHFKTLDLSKLNTEAAQPKFSNAANSTNNAVKMGYLVPSVKGQRQLSAAGEQFVRALPDREAAKSAMATVKPRRRSRRLNATGTVDDG